MSYRSAVENIYQQRTGSLCTVSSNLSMFSVMKQEHVLFFTSRTLKNNVANSARFVNGVW